MAIQVVILAAGEGKRMRSTLPKPLHTLAGRPMIEYLVMAAATLSKGTPPIIVFGHDKALFEQALKNYEVRFVQQKDRLGTGHALHQALSSIKDTDQVLILCGDLPLLSTDTLQRLLNITPQNQLGLITACLPNPTGYGRILRNADGQIIKIVEERDTTPAERAITEINAGIYLVPGKYLHQWLPLLKNDNSQGEYYLTDIIATAVKEKIPIHSLQAPTYEEIQGVNDRMQLAQLERYYQQKVAEELMRSGVTLIDPHRFDVRGEVQVGKDIVIDINVILAGKVVIGNGCIIGPNTILRDVILGEAVEIKANSVIENAEIGSHCMIGPFARIRPGTRLGPNVHVGNFVEIKNSRVDQNSKINHLSYIGDSQLGKRVNIGAGTITCNYDGVNKHQTVIGDDVFVGSDSLLVAPVKIGDGATIGAGATIIKDAPANQLTLTHHLDQRTIKSWQRPKKADTIK